MSQRIQEGILDVQKTASHIPVVICNIPDSHCKEMVENG